MILKNKVSKDMATVLKVNIEDVDRQFFLDLGQKVPASTKIEIRIPDEQPKQELFNDAQFWSLIESFDWSKTKSDEVMAAAIAQLAAMPIVNIYLFADKLAEKLYLLDSRAHGAAYLAEEEGGYLSVDDFLYVRCAVVAEGKAYYEKVLAYPSELSSEISFEPLLSLARKAYHIKTGRDFNYHAELSYETYSNQQGWK